MLDRTNKPDSCCPHNISRFIVRDFQYNEEEMKADKEEMTRLSTDKKKQFVCDLAAKNSLPQHAHRFNLISFQPGAARKMLTRHTTKKCCLFKSGIFGHICQILFDKHLNCLINIVINGQTIPLDNWTCVILQDSILPH